MASKAKVLLLKDVSAKGRKGDVVDVAPGYFRNYLEPKGFALTANAQTLRRRDRLQKERLEQAAEDKAESEKIAQRLAELTLTLERKADDAGHMYGSVSIADLLNQVKEELNIELDRHSFKGFRPLKTFGIHTVKIELQEHVPAEFTVKVLKEGEVVPETEATEEEVEEPQSS